MLKFSNKVVEKDRLDFHEKLSHIYTMINDDAPIQKFHDQLREIVDLSRKFVNVDTQEEIYKLTKTLNTEGIGDEFFYQLKQVEKVSSLDKISEPYKDIKEDYEKSYHERSIEKGSSFLCPMLDELTGGIYKGNLAVILGGTGCMKTTYASNIAYNEMLKGGNVVFISLEEQPYILYSKLLSRHSVTKGLNYATQEIINKELDEEKEKRLFSIIHKSFCEEEGNYYILGESQLGSKSQIEITDKLKEIDIMIKEKTGSEERGIDMIVVDHLQMLKYCSIEKKNEMEIMNNYVNYFRSQSLSFLGEDRQIKIILLAQANREGIEYSNREKTRGSYLIQHMAEASELERAASYVITIFTDRFNQMSKIANIGALKLRGSALPLDIVNIYADGQHYQVGELPEEREVYKDSSEIPDFNDTFDYTSTDSSTLSPELEELLGGLKL